MIKKVLGSVCLFAVVYVNQHTSVVQNMFTHDFSFAAFSAAYEKRFGPLLPSVQQTNDRQTFVASTNNLLAAEQDGVVVRIGTEHIIIQQEDGSEMEVKGLKPHSYRLFERIKQGEPVGAAAGSSIELIERKNGQILSSRKVDVDE
ncbi:hypothetical protein [Domibacillus robiginosus]|uniref:hypothetical protein n=1 Tax=Domibacillus robiginosus TaxID=1071054 RepID=UPI00067DCEE5|nr:hypothetical protein [Domibacillus robiginosus]